jgi:small subunit ribosomal protein S18
MPFELCLQGLDRAMLIGIGSLQNFSIMSEYMTPMGRIKHSKDTGLRPVNQRRIARAIRRSIGMGMMPSVHRHPEILQKIAMRNEQMSPLMKGPM